MVSNPNRNRSRTSDSYSNSESRLATGDIKSNIPLARAVINSASDDPVASDTGVGGVR